MCLRSTLRCRATGDGGAGQKGRLKGSIANNNDCFCTTTRPQGTGVCWYSWGQVIVVLPAKCSGNATENLSTSGGAGTVAQHRLLWCHVKFVFMSAEAERAAAGRQETEPMGTAGPLKLAEEILADGSGDPFFVLNRCPPKILSAVLHAFTKVDILRVKSKLFLSLACVTVWLGK